MFVWIVYQKDGYGGQEVGSVFGNEEAAIQFVVDRDSYLLELQDWDEIRLREHAKTHVERHEVLSHR
jgi:hypothetical protein